jgi:hypothetical protein
MKRSNFSYLAPAAKSSTVLAFVKSEKAERKKLADRTIVTRRAAELVILYNTRTGASRINVANHVVRMRLSLRRRGPGSKMCSSVVIACRRFLSVWGRYCDLIGVSGSRLEEDKGWYILILGQVWC